MVEFRGCFTLVAMPYRNRSSLLVAVLPLGLALACASQSTSSGGSGGSLPAGGALGSGGALVSGGSGGGTALSSGGAVVSSGGMASGGAAAGGAVSGGAAGTQGGAPAGGSSNGGSLSGGSSSGGAPLGGATANGGSAGASAVWKCPAGITGTPKLSGLTPTRVASVPPPDDFNMNNGNFGNIEGPVWIGDALYVSEMSYKSYDTQNTSVNLSRILKVTSDGTTSIAVADSGSNGLAVDPSGNILAAVHKDGTLTRFTLPGQTGTPFVTTYDTKRFNSPNDLALRSDGNIYFTDPSFQAPNSKPQTANRFYRVDPAGTVSVIQDNVGNPNGVTLSIAEDVLYLAASSGRKFKVSADGSVTDGMDFAPTNGADGLAVDCADNLYVARQGTVAVYDKNGTALSPVINVPNVQQVTNMAFGGSDHKTLYITGLGNNKGLFKVTVDIPGKQY